MKRTLLSRAARRANNLKFQFILVPVRDSDAEAAALNAFLAAHRVLSVERQFIADGANSAWAVCICFDDGVSTAVSAKTLAGVRRGKVDFKEVLSDPEFAVFARLRALRKERADAEGVPAYALFTNEQLAEMVQRRVLTATSLREIAGVGEARVEKYGAAFLAILGEAALPEPMEVVADEA